MAADIVEDNDLPMLFAQVLRLSPSFDPVAYPELLQRYIDMAKEALTVRITGDGYHAVSEPYLQITVEQMAQRDGG